MQVLWQLDQPETCTIEWGEHTSYSLGSTRTVEYGTDHQHTHTIADLAPVTRYYYRVIASEDTAAGSFRTAPAADATAVKFLAYGDTRSFPAVHDSVAEGIIATYTADEGFQSLIISVGDLVNNGNSELDWHNQFFDPFYTNIRTMLGGLPYQACMGNHEGNGILFQKYFPYPHVGGRYWSFDYGPAHFVVVDQYVPYGPGSAQLEWIEADLAATSKPWRFIYLHEPGWSAGGHANNADVQNYIQPLCVQYGVRFVFAGHNHYYARAVSNHVQHVTTGGGGAPLYTPNPNAPRVRAAAAAHHFCKVDIDGDWLTLTAVTPDGTVIDFCRVEIDGTWLTLAAVEPNGTVIDSVTKRTPVVDVPLFDPSASSRKIALHPAFPNPFREGTTIGFSAPEWANVRLGIFDVRGHRVRELFTGRVGTGYRSLPWDGTDEAGRPVPAGVYFYRLQTNAGVRGGRAVLLR
jgi:hypothetical protein